MSLPFLPPSPSSFQLTLWACAFGGSIFFLLRVMLILVGGFADDFDSPDADADFDSTVGDAHHTEAAFKLISFNTISAFIMLFGWSGLCAHIQFNLNPGISLVIGTVVGFLAMLLTGWMYKAAFRLASPGADFRIEDAIGAVGSVYQRIPADGLGKIQLSVNGMTRELDARADGDIDSFARIKVLSAIDNSTVKVETIE